MDTIEERERGEPDTKNKIENKLSTEEPWEAQVGWIYTGHGEWTQMETHEHVGEHEQLPQQEPTWIQEWWAKADDDIRLHDMVHTYGYPNRWGAKVPVKSAWNLTEFEQLLQEYEDKEVVEWLRYGWPTGRLPTLSPPRQTAKNHKGASEFPEHLKKYIKKEHSYRAVMGPFDKIPFKGSAGISPHSTRPKKDSEDRRVILDLSFLPGEAVNDGILKDTYMGLEAKLVFPKTDEFAFRIFQLGKGCFMFKIDLSRYFRQIPLGPGDYSLIGYINEGKIYFDKVSQRHTHGYEISTIHCTANHKCHCIYTQTDAVFSTQLRR